ncbi:MAG: hypothetical protein LBK82_01075 [Planctomycetaceae bacterium]|nr:hypothetical protein [Planctomycetaceae bacterium]
MQHFTPRNKNRELKRLGNLSTKDRVADGQPQPKESAATNTTEGEKLSSKDYLPLVAAAPRRS